ncbi:ssrecog-domain-containing protein [Phaffia rhodozyma]|uniref:FACT complex subunit POB3 n=1 Tax=Phaffia rhodozyma TaxID=264483 RepID=A0A0F7SLV7_PHARH|nr:ssrecog-domain-containing protein [Phaffia rhodozyma]
MSSTTQIDEVFLGSTSKLGKLRIAPTGLGWKSIEDDKESLVTLTAAEISWISWTRVARDFQISIGRKTSDERLVFEGINREDHDRIAKYIKQHWDINLEHKETSLKGWNWGQVDVQGPNLAFLVSDKPSFTIPLSSIANSNIAGKTEVSLEITPPVQPPQASGGGKSRVRPIDELVELRFHIPGQAEESGSESEGENEEISKAQAFHDMIKERAEITEGGGEGVVVFNEVLVLTPRGRYDIDMFLTHFRLRGKTYDYKIMHSSVTRLFLLPKADEIHVQLVVGLDPAIRQGQTRYPYLVMQFTKDEEMDAELNLTEEELKENNLMRKYEAPAFSVVSQVFKALTGKKIIPPSSFVSTSGQNVVKCNLKANQGELYFLEKSMIFIAKQPLLVEFANIQTLSFSRVGGNMASSKTFDMSISLKNRTDGGSDYSFTSLSKDDAEPIKAFLMERKVKVKDKTEDDVLTVQLSDEDEDMESDEDSEDSEEENGGRKKQPKDGQAKRKKPVALAKAPVGGDDDEDESEDEDFQASSSDGGSATSSSDESDSDAEAGGGKEEAESDVEMDEPKKKKSGDDGPVKKKAKKD